MKVSAKITFGVMALAVVASAVAMVMHLGLIEGLDFGCGQYYYTDIPGWEKYFSVERFKDGLPLWLYFVLFFAWGGAMFALWSWVDSKSDE